MEDKKKKISFWKSKTFLVIVVVLLLFRIALPSTVKYFLNKQLSTLDGYSGKIEDVDIALYRGAYKIDGFSLISNDAKEVPLIKIETVDLSVEWKSIFNGSLVGEIDIIRPQINLTTGLTQTDSVETKSDNNFDNVEDAGWKDVVTGLFPLKINRLGLTNAEIHYKDLSSTPIMDVFIDSINGNITNLTNSTKLSKDKVASIDIKARAMSEAGISLKGSLDPYEDDITSKMNITMEDLQLESINNYLDYYAKIDAERGTINLYSEIDIIKGNVEGYLKPLIKNAKFLAIRDEDKDDSFVDKIREGAVNIASNLFENNKKDQIGSKILINGNINDPDINITKAITSFLGNAFLKAIKEGLEPDLIK